MPWELPIFTTRALMIYLLDRKGIHIVITLVWNVKDLKVQTLKEFKGEK
jgi:hypothetical protein